MNTTDLTPQIAATLVGSVLEPYVAEYRSKLESSRYAANTRYVYAGCIGHFARWLTAERIGLEGVNEEAGRCFINVHLPRCNCPPPSRRSPSDIKAALSHLFDVLRDREHSLLPLVRPTTYGPNLLRLTNIWTRSAALLPKRADSAFSFSLGSSPRVSDRVRSLRRRSVA
jgi:hypothetical protein